jgi:hypothetical protein
MRIVALVLLLLAAPAGAATIVLDFDEEPTGERGASFTSAEAPFVQLTETGGTDLQVFDYPGHGLVLWVGDEGGMLRLDFGVPVLSITIEFGDAGALAGDWDPPVLVGLNGSDVLAIDSTVPDFDGELDESLTVAVPSGAFDAAVFAFVQRGEMEPESPLVGRIILVTSEVPEPAAAMLLLAAAGWQAARARSRSRRRPADRSGNGPPSRP